MNVNIHAYMEVIRIRIIQDDSTGSEGNTGILDMLICTRAFLFCVSLSFACEALWHVRADAWPMPVSLSMLLH